MRKNVNDCERPKTHIYFYDLRSKICMLSHILAFFSSPTQKLQSENFKKL